jgi:hypothetical protein
MSTRSSRSLFLGALVLAFSPALLPASAPQGDGPASAPSAAPDRVKAFASALREVVKIGGTVTPVLAAQSKSENTITSTLVKSIGEAIKEKAAGEGVDTAPAAVEPKAKALVLAAHDLLGMRERALPALAEAIGDSKNEDVKPFLAKAESRMYVTLTSSTIRGYLGSGSAAQGTFDGMFASLEKLDRQKVADAFLDILSSTTQQRGARDLAGEGLAQLGSKRHIEPLRAIMADSNPSHDAVRQRVVYTLARLGDRSFVDQQFADLAKKMAEAKKPEMTPQETAKWADYYRQMAVLYQNIHDNDAAIKNYESFLSGIQPVTDKLGPQVAGIFQNVFYNLACLYALKGNVEVGFNWLEKALASGYNNFKWANTDGDLAALRKDPRFKPLIETWESGKGTAESAPATRPG